MGTGSKLSVYDDEKWIRDLEQYRMIAFGGAMVLIMVFKPKGILANRKPTILMHGDKK